MKAHSPVRERDDGLAAHVADRAPDVYITFLSILVGIVLADLLQMVLNDLPLWPIDARTVMTWGQIVGMVSSALGTWAVYAHLAIAQRQTPRFSESLAAFVGPLLLLVANSFVGVADSTAWFLMVLSAQRQLVSEFTWRGRGGLALAHDRAPLSQGG